ncbi:DUF1269 domain-containing protein [Streptomyces sp. UNOC14_S4]|uniref:DUF1269 domain-containing protein n=1 Tax=Streptomyces sp. UNOC14_S4 TaxID=2872340 RepID=UPI001E3D3809|nr:DUF1269 domain-containing protein [Streptomyces sp. UNOC14_S4]MCC3766655.1 DUF1269 domain-containing protein [Streptomyces sp. UNOC14_S4]
MDEHVLFMTVDGPHAGHRALEALRKADDDGDVKLHEAVVITRDADGTLDFPDAEDNTGVARGFTVGSLVGGLVGILGGPLGVMIGFGAGGLAGGMRDAREATAAAAAVEMLAAEVPPGATVLIAEVREKEAAELDAVLEPYGTGLERYPARDVRRAVEEAISGRA